MNERCPSLRLLRSPCAGPRSVLRSAVTAAGAAVVIAAAGCSSGPGRPVLADSVVPTTGGVASSADDSNELDFLDALAARPLVCHDEAIHAALLLGNGPSGATPGERVALAKQLGYIDPAFDRSPREAATVGEVSQMVAVIMDSGTGSPARRLTQDQALIRLAGRGLMPSNLRAHQGLTGAQLVTILGGARTAMGDRPRMQVPPGSVAAASPASGRPFSSALVSAEATSAGGASAGEPLPPAATDPTIERSAVRVQPAPLADPHDSAVVAQPAAAEPTPPPPPPSEPAPPARVWVPGKPLKKPGA